MQRITAYQSAQPCPSVSVSWAASSLVRWSSAAQQSQGALWSLWVSSLWPVSSVFCMKPGDPTFCTLGWPPYLPPLESISRIEWSIIWAPMRKTRSWPRTWMHMRNRLEAFHLNSHSSSQCRDMVSHSNNMLRLSSNMLSLSLSQIKDILIKGTHRHILSNNNSNNNISRCLHSISPNSNRYLMLSSSTSTSSSSPSFNSSNNNKINSTIS